MGKNHDGLKQALKMDIIMKRNSIQGHFLRYYGVFALVIFVMLTFFINIMFRLQYQKVAIEKRERDNEAIVNLFNEKLKYDVVEEGYINGVAEQLLTQGVVLMIENQGELTYCVSCLGGDCNQMMEAMHQKLQGFFPWASDDYHEGRYLLEDLETSLIFAHYGEFTLLESDIAFLKKMNILFFVMGSFAVFGFLIVGSYSSKKVSKPLQYLIEHMNYLEQQPLQMKQLHIEELELLQKSFQELQTRLAYQKKFQERLNKDVAHELRTPLAILQTTIEAMIDGVVEVDKPHLESLYEEIVRLHSLIYKIERIHQSSDELHKENVDVKEVMEDLSFLFEVEGKKKNITLRRNFEACQLRLDKNQFKQVIVNGMSNAMKYSYENSEIEWEGFVQNNSYAIEIIDYGSGIDEKDIPHVFDYLYRSDDSRSRESGGQGIGLSIVKSIVEQHGGTVMITSNNEKTILSILLPLT